MAGQPDGPRRVFAAIELPPAVRSHLAEAVRVARASTTHGEPDPVRWSGPGSWHLTLAFYGAVQPAQAAALADRLGRAARRFGPVTLTLSGAGRFGHRVLWAGVDGDRAALVALAGRVAAAGRRVGLLVDDRPYRPHLTLARGRPGADLAPAVQRLRDYTGPAWVADQLTLVHSRLGAGPAGTAVHTIAEQWSLGPGS